MRWKAESDIPKRPGRKPKAIETAPLDPTDEKTLRELPIYWRMMQNAKASRKLIISRIKALCIVAQNLDDRIEKLKIRIADLQHENVVLKDEIAELRRRRQVHVAPPQKRSAPRRWWPRSA